MARVPYRNPDELPESYRDLVVSSLQPGKTVNVYSAIANNPPVLEGLRGFLGSLWAESGLSDRERELVILTVAREVDAAYEWHQHVNVARSVGITDAEIKAVGEGDLSEFSDREATLVRYARATVHGSVDDADWSAVESTYDDSTIVGITSLAAGYAALALLIDALAVDVEDEFVGWNPSARRD